MVHDTEITQAEQLAHGAKPHQALGFSPDQIASAFTVEEHRVRAAILGEFGKPLTEIDSRQAQHLAEALLTDRPLDARQAALMQLGAFTPRSDLEWGLGDTAPGEESDRLAASADRPDDDLASHHSSYDPATQAAE